MLNGIGQAAPLLLDASDLHKGPLLVIKRRGHHRGIRCLLHLHPWRPWTENDGHQALVQQVDGRYIPKAVMVSRRWCPLCSAAETRVFL